MAEIHAAGAVLWRPGEQIALVHRPHYDDWSLPKGKLEAGESVWFAAVREVAEETGFIATLGRHLGQIRYPVGRPRPATKVVDYFAARAGAGQFQPNKEVDDLRWVSPAEADVLLSHQGDREILREFLAVPADTTTLALVRHAVAGDRATWHGTDELRPLTEEGWQQAQALRKLLPLFGVNRVHSALLLRCVQTVRELAEDLGTPIVEEPLLSEAGYRANIPAAIARFRELASAGGVAVVCSQGGVIPDLLSRLAKDSNVALDEPRSDKGSVWILSFTAPPQLRLVDADYIPKP